jgi:hypothetical protein
MPRKQPGPAHVRPTQAVLAGHGCRWIGECHQPLGGARRETGSEYRTELRYEIAVAVRPADDPEAADGPRRVGQPPPERCDLSVETPHGRTHIGQEIPDLDGDSLSTVRSREDDVDGSRPQDPLIDSELRLGGPTSPRCELDDEALATQMREVVREISSGPALQKGGKLLTDRCGNDGPGLERGVRSLPALEMADESLRQPCAVGEIDLAEACSQPALAKTGAQTGSEHSRSRASDSHRNPGATFPAEAGHELWVPEPLPIVRA